MIKRLLMLAIIGGMLYGGYDNINNGVKFSLYKRQIIYDLTGHKVSDTEARSLTNGSETERAMAIFKKDGSVKVVFGTYRLDVNEKKIKWKKISINEDKTYPSYEIQCVFGKVYICFGDKKYHLYRNNENKLFIEFF